MSVHFIRCLQHSSIRTGPNTFLRVINAPPDRNYHAQNSGILRKSTKEGTAVKYWSVRNSSTTPPDINSSTTSPDINSSTTLPDIRDITYDLPEPLKYLRYDQYQGPILKVVEEYAQSDLVLSATEKMVQFHDFVGLPWWSVIVMTTFAARTLITLPFAIHQQYVSSKYEQVMHELNTVVDKEVTQTVRKLAAENKWNQDRMTHAYLMLKEDRKTHLIKKYNCHPLKLTVLVLVQMPIWCTFSCVLRNLTYMLPVPDATAQIVCAEMKLNSFLWMSDLTHPDPALSVLFTIGNMLVIGTNVISRKGKKTVLEKLFVLFHGTFCIMLSTFAQQLPLSVLLYWTTSTWYSVVQNLIFLSPKIRSRLNIPLNENLRPNPFKRVMNKFKSIYKFIRY